MATVKHIFDDD